MKRIVWLLMLFVSLTLWSCGQCAGICSPTVEVTLVDMAGNAARPLRGTVTFDGTSGEFECGSFGTSTTGALQIRVDCRENLLTFWVGFVTSMALTVADNEQRTFSGSIPLSFKSTGASVCGSSCDVAAATVIAK